MEMTNGRGVVQTKQSELLTEILPFVFLRPPEFSTIFLVINRIGKGLRNDTVNNIEQDVNKEFVRFFRVNGTDYLPPYESCWVLKPQKEDMLSSPRLFSRTTEEMENILREFGIVMLENYNEPADHLSFELSLYFSLYENSPDESRQLKNKFTNEHFDKWVPEYLRNLSEKEGIFYPVVAGFLLNIIRPHQ